MSRRKTVNTTRLPAAGQQRKPVALLLVVPLVAALLLTLFAWPSARLEPRDLPVAVAGPAPTAQAIEQRLAARDGAFDVRRIADEASARGAIEDREVYGAFVATPDGPKVLVASAASPVVAQSLAHAASDDGTAPVQVEDVVAAGARGTSLASSVLPLALAGILCGVLCSLLASGVLARAGLIAAGSVLVGLATTAVVQGWLDVLRGDWWLNATGLSLTVLAIAAAVAGLKALMGEAGAILGALTMVLVGNPFSGVATGPELLPEPVGAIGQLLPLGAGGNLLRSTSYFDGAGAGGHVAVLAVWTLAGLAALAAARALNVRPAALDPAR
jgi:hypothetical protein